MDAVQDLPEQTSAEMRQDIDATRAAMADKLEALEDRVMDSVQSAQDTVEDSIQMAKDTVATVKRTFDIKHQVQQHPWVMVGGGFVAGLALGNLVQMVRRRSRPAPDRLMGNESSLTLPSPLGGENRVRSLGGPPLPADYRDNGSLATAGPSPRIDSAPPTRPGFFDQFQDEIDQVKGMAIGYVMGLVRDSIKDSVPQMATQIDGVMNSVTTKLGGEPVHQHCP